MAAKSSKTRSFEACLEELEKIVLELEKGEIPLEDQLAAFEKGVKCSRECLNRLEEIERRVELVSEKDGQLGTEPLAVS